MKGVLQVANSYVVLPLDVIPRRARRMWWLILGTEVCTSRCWNRSSISAMYPRMASVRGLPGPRITLRRRCWRSDSGRSDSTAKVSVVKSLGSVPPNVMSTSISRGTPSDGRRNSSLKQTHCHPYRWFGRGSSCSYSALMVRSAHVEPGPEILEVDHDPIGGSEEFDVLE